LWALISKDLLNVLVVYFVISALLLLSGFPFSPSEFLDSVPVLLSVGLLLPIFCGMRVSACVGGFLAERMGEARVRLPSGY
jgi:hypothetical protein